MKENYQICNCMKVSFYDVEEAVEKAGKMADLEKEFDAVQALTKCSTGCGGCHDRILDAISEIMNS